MSFYFRNLYCLDWLKTNYWEKEIVELREVTINDLKPLPTQAYEAKLNEMFLVYDASIEGLTRGYVNYQQADDDKTWPQERKDILKNCLVAFESTRLLGIRNFVSNWIITSMKTNDMLYNAKAFFQTFIKNCEYLMENVSEGNNSIPLKELH